MTDHVHSPLGASAAHRWWHCPGSVALCATVPNTTNCWAEEGSAAHLLAETCLRSGTLPHDEAVALYVEYVRSLVDGDDVFHVEQRVNLAALGEPEMFGTADFVLYKRRDRRLYVVDYKHGAGVAVEVEDNKQLRYYALGALLALEHDLVVDEVELIIVQPRAAHHDGPIRRECITLLDLMVFAADLIDAAARTREPDAPLVPGAWCRFCSALAICPAVQQHALETAQRAFGQEMAIESSRHVLSPDDLGHLLNKAEIIEHWVAALRAFAHGELASGRAIPGWKLVPKRALRKWRDENTARLELDSVAPPEKVCDLYKLRTPAQVEKVLPTQRALIKNLVVAESSGSTLAPASDRRAALPSAVDVFALSDHEDIISS